MVKYENLVSSQSFPSFPESTSEKIVAKSLVRAVGSFFPSFPGSTSEIVVGKLLVRPLSFFSRVFANQHPKSIVRALRSFFLSFPESTSEKVVAQSYWFEHSYLFFASFPESTSERNSSRKVISPTTQVFFSRVFPETASEKVVSKSLVQALGFFPEFLRVSIRKSSRKVIGSSARIFFRVTPRHQRKRHLCKSFCMDSQYRMVSELRTKHVH